MKSTKDINQVRATFNDTKKAQEKLRVLFDTLEEQNSFVEDKTFFFNLLADSLLGLDFEKQGIIYLKDTSVIRIKNIGKFLRETAYITDNDFGFLKKYYKINSQNLDMGQLWHGLKFEVFGIFPEALAMSIRISKEQTHLGVSESGGV